MSTSRRALRDDVRLLERSDQLSALAASLDAVIAEGTGALVLVGGEAGVGKTALLQAFCDGRRASARILWGACEGLLTPGPLGPLFDVAEATGGELEELVSSGARPHEVTAALIRELGRGRATILVLEDLHWADEATLDVLRLLARKVAGRSRARPRQLPRRPARSRASAHPRPRRADHGARGQAARGPDPLGGRRRRARRAPRDRRAGPLPPDQRQPLLRHRGAGGGYERDPAHRARRGARAGRAPLRSGAQVARGDRDRDPAGRGLAAGGARPRRARPSRGVPGVGDGRRPARRRVVQARARATGRRGGAPAPPPGRASSRRGRGAGGGGPRRGPRADRASRRRGGRRGGGAALRARGGGARGVARRPSRSRGAVRARAALRRGPAPRGAGRATGAARLRGLPHRRVRRRRSRRRSAPSPIAGRSATSFGGRLPALALAPVSLSRAHQGRRRGRPPGGRQPRGAAPGRELALPTSTSGICTRSRRTPTRPWPGARRRSRSASSSTIAQVRVYALTNIGIVEVFTDAPQAPAQLAQSLELAAARRLPGGRRPRLPQSRVVAAAPPALRPRRPLPRGRPRALRRARPRSVAAVLRRVPRPRGARSRALGRGRGLRRRSPCAIAAGGPCRASSRSACWGWCGPGAAIPTSGRCSTKRSRWPSRPASCSGSGRRPPRGPRRRGWKVATRRWSARPTAALELALRRQAPWAIGELACWRRRAGISEVIAGRRRRALRSRAGGRLGARGGALDRARLSI